MKKEKSNNRERLEEVEYFNSGKSPQCFYDYLGHLQVALPNQKITFLKFIPLRPPYTIGRPKREYLISEGDSE